jgi:CubicO group peptidase (beta-lactamase class C family)
MAMNRFLIPFRAPGAALLRALLASLLLTLPAAAQLRTDPVFPGETWEMVGRADLGAYGWDAAKLRAAQDFVRDSSWMTGVVVVDRGRVVSTFGDIVELSYLASARKSVLSMLYGNWVENGVIDLEKTLADLGMDDIGGLLPIEKQARILDLITARSGVYHPASNGGDDLASAPPRGSQKPGTYQLYSNWDFNAAGAVFEQLTGRDIYDEVQAQLAIPLQFEDWDRSAQRKSGDLTISVNPAYHMWLSTRDMARIGLLMLNEGSWNGKQIIPRGWAKEIVRPVTPLGEMNPVRRRDGYFGYGYMWWVWDGPKATGPFEGAYTARGAVGQWIAVFPAVDLVVAVKTNSVYGREASWASFERMLELLFEARGVAPAPAVGWPWRK